MKRAPPWGVGHDINTLDIHPLQLLEWQLLTISDEDFKQFLQTQAPVVGGQKVAMTGDPVIDEFERMVAEDLAKGGEGVPDGW